MTNLDYWQNSKEYDAVRVRKLILSWLDGGSDRHYNSEMEYLSDENVYKKACAVYGYEWDVGLGT